MKNVGELKPVFAPADEFLHIFQKIVAPPYHSWIFRPRWCQWKIGNLILELFLSRKLIFQVLISKLSHQWKDLKSGWRWISFTQTKYWVYDFWCNKKRFHQRVLYESNLCESIFIDIGRLFPPIFVFGVLIWISLSRNDLKGLVLGLAVGRHCACQLAATFPAQATPLSSTPKSGAWRRAGVGGQCGADLLFKRIWPTRPEEKGLQTYQQMRPDPRPCVNPRL